MSIFRRAIQKGEFATTFFHVFPAEGFAPKEQKMRKFTTITAALVIAVLPVGMTWADSSVATPASVVGAPLTVGESDFNYEGDALIDGRNHNVGNPDPQGWTQSITETNVGITTWSAVDGVATVQQTSPLNGADGAILDIAMKAADGSDGLGHTVDVRAWPGVRG